MLDEVLGIPDQLHDALWRVDTARLQAADAAGLAVCGVGTSALGADLAAAALGGRAGKPLLTVRDYALPGWVGPEWTVLCSSYSGEDEEAIACFEAATALGAHRIVAGTGGALVDRAREDGVPVVGLPGIIQPRAVVAYTFTIAAEVAALAGAAPRLRTEIEAAAGFLAEQVEQLKFHAAEVAGLLEGTLPVVYGADLTVPVARRWKAQANENARQPAFFAELPEDDQGELWSAEAGDRRLSAVFLEDRDQDPRISRRFELAAEAVSGAGATAVRVETAGQTRTARLLWATMLADLVSLELARQRGTDPPS